MYESVLLVGAGRYGVQWHCMYMLCEKTSGHCFLQAVLSREFFDTKKLAMSQSQVTAVYN